MSTKVDLTGWKRTFCGTPLGVGAGGVVDQSHRHSRLPPLQRTQGRGTRHVGDGGEVQSLVQPPRQLPANAGVDREARGLGWRRWLSKK